MNDKYKESKFKVGDKVRFTDDAFKHLELSCEKKKYNKDTVLTVSKITLRHRAKPLIILSNNNEIDEGWLELVEEPVDTKYKYLPLSKTKIGSMLEAFSPYSELITEGNLYVIKDIYTGVCGDGIYWVIDDSKELHRIHLTDRQWKLVDTSREEPVELTEEPANEYKVYPPENSPLGWFVRTKKDNKIKYLRKDLSILQGTGHCTENDCYFETELDANNALEQYYLKNNVISEETNTPEPRKTIGPYEKQALENAYNKLTKIKENNMRENTIEIKVNGKDINLCEEPVVAETKTDLEQKPKYLTVWYNPKGTEVDNTWDSPKEATKLLQSPTKLGWTFVSYKQSISRTTAIPVVDVG